MAKITIEIPADKANELLLAIKCGELEKYSVVDAQILQPPTPIKVVHIEQTCDACPSQWNGLTDDNRQFYARFRWGKLSICMSEPNDTGEYAGVRGKEIFFKQRSDGLDGHMTYEELVEETKGLIEWPKP